MAEEEEKEPSSDQTEDERVTIEVTEGRNTLKDEEGANSDTIVVVGVIISLSAIAFFVLITFMIFCRRRWIKKETQDEKDEEKRAQNRKKNKGKVIP